MKKLLMCSAAIALGLAVAAPAKADGIKLDLAGHFKGYVTWLSQDTNDEPLAKASIRHFDILRETEIHFTGETTLDNGLTVGVHHQALIDSPTTDGLGELASTFSPPGNPMPTSPVPGAASTSARKTVPTTCWKSLLRRPTRTSTACVSTSTRSI